MPSGAATRFPGSPHGNGAAASAGRRAHHAHIARRLGISEGLRTHLVNIYTRLNVPSRTPLSPARFPTELRRAHRQSMACPLPFFLAGAV